MRVIRTVWITAIAVLPLMTGGCSTLHSLTAASPRPPVGNDIPEAARMDEKREQTLFLAVVEGLRDGGQSRAALAYLDAFDKTYPGVPDAALLRAECLLDVGKPAEAAPVFAGLITTSYAAAANAGLGKVAAASGDWTTATRNFREASRLEPSRAQYANDLGFAELRQGDYSGAIDMLSRAAELAPDNKFIRNNLIIGLHLSGRNQEAARLIDGIAEPDDQRAARQMLLVSARSVQPAAAIVSNTPAKGTKS